MNIKRAKEEIKHALWAYLAKDEFGEYKIPAVRQRPVLLMGPPGIGKTAIMEQISRECNIGLVAYTITHHTRQSAVGLPFIEKKQYGGKEYSVTEYTMSEIIASVYEKMEKTGVKEGILFIDEINCVSETLAPTMLQFLQGKTFGNQRVPEGWVIIAAGNPPEYNKSVRDFDIVTLDRVKRIDVKEDYSVWKEYASKQGIHPAIVSYLDIKKENFYVMETTIDGVRFVTARGWEDLSEVVYQYEELDIPVDEEVIAQYLQHPAVAKDFSDYLDLFNKYKNDYDMEQVLLGNLDEVAAEKLQAAPFDEKLSVISLLLSRLSDFFHKAYVMDRYVTGLYECMKQLKKMENENIIFVEELRKQAEGKHHQLELLKEESRSDKVNIKIENLIIHGLEKFAKEMLQNGETTFDAIREMFQKETILRENAVNDASDKLEYAFSFMEEAFGESQEMVIFITELTRGYYSMKFIGEYGSEKYYQYNKSLLFHDTTKNILDEIQSVKEMELEITE